MWSNFNDSFSAITGHISDQIRQSIPTLSDQQNQQQQMITKIGLLRNEVCRHRNIAKMYKERWLKAENVCKDSIGHCSQIYDDVNLLDEEEDNEDQEEDQEAAGIAVRPLKLDSLDGGDDPKSNDNDLSSLLLSKQEKEQRSVDELALNQDEPQQSKNVKSSTKNAPQCIQDLYLDSAVVQINCLKDGIKKLQTDGEHWRKLAKQKSAREEAQLVDLEQIRSQLKNCQGECQEYRERCSRLEISVEKLREESQQELQQLDSLHEQENAKLLALRDELWQENARLKQGLKDSIESNDRPALIESSNVSTQTAVVQCSESATEMVRQEGTENIVDVEDHHKFIQECLGRLEWAEEDLQILQKEKEPKQRFEKMLRLLCKRMDLLPVPTITEKEEEEEEEEDVEPERPPQIMTLLDEQPTTTLNHGGQRQQNDQHLLNELEKISQEKCQLEHTLNELQLKLMNFEREQESQQQLQQLHSSAINITNANDGDLLSRREEPEGANNDQNEQQQDSNTVITEQQQRADSALQLVEELQTKLSLLTNEHEELGQKFNSAQNENQIFERRFKETEEECIKLSHKIHQTEQERDGLKAQLAKNESQQSQLEQDLNYHKTQLANQMDLIQKNTIELEHWRNQCETLKQQLQQVNEDNFALKSSLSTKDNELIQLREDAAKSEQTEVIGKQEQIENLTNELNRLREHLVQVEETYTNYLEESEERLEQSKQTIKQYEQMNFAVKQAEYDSLTRSLRMERDQAHQVIHQLEDKCERLAANLVNLQSVIEQLEKEHERKLQSLNEEHAKQMSIQDGRAEEWRKRLQTCEQHLHETRQALEAASRLSEKIDQKELIIEQLKREVKAKDQDASKLRQKIEDLEQSTEGKVDKQIVKSLVLSYLATPMDKRSDAERLLARFLDFNQEEMDRVGIRVGRDAATAKMNDSFTSRFVQFLETESTKNADNSSPDVNKGAGERRSSMNMNSSSPHQMELARDLNRRLHQHDQASAVVSAASLSSPTTTAVATRMNPFVGQPNPSRGYHQQHSRGGSHSSTDSLIPNQLFANTSLVSPLQPPPQSSSSSLNFNFSLHTPAAAPAGQNPTSSEIIMDVLCKDKII